MGDHRQFKQNRWSLAPLFFRFLVISTVIWLALLVVTLGITLQFSHSVMQEKLENELTSTAVTLANSDIIKQSIANGRCSEECTNYLDSLIKNNPDLDIITVADRQSVRLYHVNHYQVGKKFVGGDEDRVLVNGETYLNDAVGTMGLQHRAFAPIRDTQGDIVGFVMASTTMSRLDSLRKNITAIYGKLALGVILISILVAWLLSILIKRMLLGYSPGYLVHTYLVQNEILNNLSEGIVSVDKNGYIQLANTAAGKMLGQSIELLEGKKIDNLITDAQGQSLLKSKITNASTSKPKVLCTSVPLGEREEHSNTTLILTDKTEALQLAEQLNGSRHIVSMLRANKHEFMNKLHVISGMLQMGKQKDALQYIDSFAVEQAYVMGPVLQHIRNTSAAALILGKLGNMKELEIVLTLLPNSSLPEHSQYLSTNELITVLGNLLENAIEAINMNSAGKPRNIVLQIIEDQKGLSLNVSDTGIGIKPEILPRIYDNGFSTKDEKNRGVGMSLVKSIVDKHHGNIEVDSEPDNGTSFSIYIFEKRRQGA